MAVKGTLKSNGNEILIKQNQIEGLDNFNAATAQTATKAIQDGEGRNIYSTYATKEELANAELGTGSTSADDIYLRRDGGNKIKYDLKFESSVHGIVLGDGTNGFGFTDENEPVIVNNTGRYLNISIDKFDGNYVGYHFPDNKDYYNVATKEELEDGTIIPKKTNYANTITTDTYIEVIDEHGAHQGLKLSEYFEADGRDLTGNVKKAKKVSGEDIIMEPSSQVKITKPGLYLCCVRGNMQGYYYHTCIIDIPVLEHNYALVLDKFLGPSEYTLTVSLNYNGSGNYYYLEITKEDEDNIGYDFYHCKCLMEF